MYLFKVFENSTAFQKVTLRMKYSPFLNTFDAYSLFLRSYKHKEICQYLELMIVKKGVVGSICDVLNEVGSYLFSTSFVSIQN